MRTSLRLPIIEPGGPQKYNFHQALQEHALSVQPISVETLQVNITKLCNQACRHCHVDASPKRTEQMDRRTMERCLEILAFVGLDPFIHRRAGLLSGGMRQKLSLAAALVHRPRILLLDEPTTGVDPVTRQDFWQLIIRLVAEEDVAILVSTPYMDEAARCQRVGFLLEGRKQTEGTPEQLRSRLEGRVIELRGQPLLPLRDLARQDPAVDDVHMFGDRIHLRTFPGQAPQVIARLSQAIPAAGLSFSSLRLSQPQLEDVFMALTETKG